MFGFGRKKTTTTTARLTEHMPIRAGELDTTFGEMRFHAQNLVDGEARNFVEEGLARAILSLLDEIERREVQSRER